MQSVPSPHLSAKRGGETFLDEVGGNKNLDCNAMHWSSNGLQGGVLVSGLRLTKVPIASMAARHLASIEEQRGASGCSLSDESIVWRGRAPPETLEIKNVSGWPSEVFEGKGKLESAPSRPSIKGAKTNGLTGGSEPSRDGGADVVFSDGEKNKVVSSNELCLSSPWFPDGEENKVVSCK